MSNPRGNDTASRAERICNRLQSLLDQWADSIPSISVASGNTLISQFNFFVSTMKEDVRKEEWALHDMPYLLMQTLSQLWDLEENVDILVSNGIINSVKDVYLSLSSVLLPLQVDAENRFPEFLALLSTIVSFFLLLHLVRSSERYVFSRAMGEHLKQFARDISPAPSKQSHTLSKRFCEHPT